MTSLSIKTFFPNNQSKKIKSLRLLSKALIFDLEMKGSTLISRPIKIGKFWYSYVKIGKQNYLEKHENEIEVLRTVISENGGAGYL